MNVINNISAFLQTNLDSIVYEECKLYRWSPYIIKINFANGMYFFCTFTSALVRLTYSEYLEISSIILQRQQITNLGRQLLETLNHLLLLRIIIPTTLDEQHEVSKIRNIIITRRKYDNKIRYADILPTTGCNARCSYCFEHNIPPVHMTANIAQNIGDFISTKSANSLVLKWFGGEPLVNTQSIDEICARIDSKIQFTSYMITNGFLFDDYLISKSIKKWNLTTVQITLDGTKEYYNRVKSYKTKCSDPFEKVLSNIQKLLDNNINVIIRLNLGIDNYNSILSLLSILKVRFNGYNNIKVYSRLLYFSYQSELSSVEKKELLKKAYYVDNLISEIGFNKPKTMRLPQLAVRSCMADREGYIMINPNGDIGVCEHHIFDEVIGNVQDYMNSDFRIPEEWQKYKYRNRNCSKCKLFPLCLINSKCKAKETDIYECVIQSYKTKNYIKQYLLNIRNKNHQDSLENSAMCDN